MSKAEALKAARRDLPAAEQYKVFPNSGPYPGVDTEVLVRASGTDSPLASHAALYFQKDVLKYFRLKQKYFDAENMDGTEFRQAILKSYPISGMTCRDNIMCSGSGPAGETVTINPFGVEVYQPLPPPPAPPKPKFD